MSDTPRYGARFVELCSNDKCARPDRPLTARETSENRLAFALPGGGKPMSLPLCDDCYSRFAKGSGAR